MVDTNIPAASTSATFIIQRHLENSILLDSPELTAACNALGRYHKEQDVYFTDTDDDNYILDATKDLIRYLRKDGVNHEVRRYFGQAKIVENNLIPILIKYRERNDFVDILLRLLGNLTSPALLLFEEEIPTDKVTRHYFLEILEHLQYTKECFIKKEVWACLTERLAKILEKSQHERSSEHELIIERILILVRNVLSVPADASDEKRADNDVSVQDRLLWIMDKSGFMDLLHYMVSSDQEEAYYMYLLEILSHMLRDHRAQDLALMSDTRSESERVQDEKEFSEIRKRELMKRNQRMKKYTSARHSRFGGTFMFQNMKSVNDSQELIYHKKLNSAGTLDFDSNKSATKIAKNRQSMREGNWKRRSPFATRLQLKSFCIEFLNSGYNRLMHDVRGKLVRGKAMENDETYYLWALQFFMEFNRYYKFNVKLISETIGREIFHYVQQRLETYFDMIQSDKKKFYLWSKRLHLGILAYKELLYTISTMDKSTDESIREHARIIKSNIFYVVEYREFILTLLAAYNDKKMSDLYLLDLIETQHIFLKMLEAYCGKSAMVVKQVKQIRKKKKKTNSDLEPTLEVPFEQVLELKWDELASQITTVLEGGENIPEIAPFDATSDVPDDQQRKNAMIRIQDYFREEEVENGIGLLRSARDVWPQNDAFGSSGMTPEEEFLAIREIFFAKIRDKEEMRAQHPAPVEEEEEEEDEDDEDGRTFEVEKEVDFQFIDFVKRFVQPKIIAACGLALRNFDTNPPHINHCILKLLHRVAFDCKMPAMLFQASIFRTFQRIFDEAELSQHKELVKFAVYIIRQFVRVAEYNKKVFMELLFWKNSKQAFDCEQGYGSYESSSKAMKKAWTEEQENELRVLVMEHKERGIEEDLVDWLSTNLIDNTKTHLQISRKIKQLHLVTGDELKKNKSSHRPPQEWSESEVSQLEELWNQFQDAMDPLGCITERLDVKRPKMRVKQKILELGLADNKALRKKRTKKSGGLHEEEQHYTSREFISDNDDNSSSNNSSDNEEDRNNRPVTQKKIKTLQKREKRSTTKKTPPSKKLELPVLKKLVLDIIGRGMTESLKWISENLLETAEDQEQDINLDGNEGIPLVAINETDMHAIQSPVFEKFLLGIGILKPSSEQEKFWRIPGNMPAAELKHHANFIDEIVEKGVDAFPDYNVPPPAQKSDDDDDDVFDRVRNFMHKNTENRDYCTDSQNISQTTQSLTNSNNRIASIESSDNDLNNDQIDTVVEYDLQNGVMTQSSTSSIKPSKKTKKITMINDSDNSDIEINENTSNVEEIQNTYSFRHSKRNSVLHSDESDTEDIDAKSENNSNIEIIKNTNNVDEIKNTKLSKHSKRISVLDSDESDTEEIDAKNYNNSNIEKNENTNNVEEIQNTKLSKHSKRISVLDSDESDTEDIDAKSDNNFNIEIIDNTNNVEKNQNTKLSKHSKRISVLDSDDSDTEDIDAKSDNNFNIEIIDNTNNVEKIQNTKLSEHSKRISVLDSDDSDTEDIDAKNDDTVAKRSRESDSESNTHLVKRKKLIIDSDED